MALSWDTLTDGHASLIPGISGAVPEFPEINFEIVPKIRKYVVPKLAHFQSFREIPKLRRPAYDVLYLQQAWAPTNG